MSTETLTALIALVTAVVSGVIAIISAWRGETTRKAAAAAAIRTDFQIGHLNNWVTEVQNQQVAPPPPGAALVPGVSFGDLLKYVALGQQLATILDGLNLIDVGETTETPTIKSTWRSKRFELPTGPLKRTK